MTEEEKKYQDLRACYIRACKEIAILLGDHGHVEYNTKRLFKSFYNELLARRATGEKLDLFSINETEHEPSYYQSEVRKEKLK